MSIRIEIRSTDLRPREIVSRKNGKTFSFLEQVAYAFTTNDRGEPNPYPEKITLTLPRGREEAYPQGEYTLHPASFYVGAYGSLECSPRLAPVKAR